MRTIHPVFLLSLASLALAGCTARTAEGGSDNGLPTSGSHTAHLEAPLPQPIGCPECHNPAFQVTLEGRTARANGAVGTYSYTARTCSGVYCHDGGVTQVVLGGGTVPTPIWDPPSTIACGACHASPGGAVATPWHPVMAAGIQCALCHPGYTNTSVNLALHINTVVDLDPPTLGDTCSACHGLATRTGDEVARAAPPKDRSGSSDTRMPGVGAHQSHLDPPPGAISLPIACTECHVVPPVTGPDRLAHVGPTRTSPAKLSWGPLASAGGAVPSYDRVSGTCTNYCHGQTLTPPSGTITQPLWTKVDGTQDACGTCHASPPTDAAHSLHAGPSTLFLPCSACHPTGYAINSVGPEVTSIHVNGVRNVNGTTLPLWNPTAVGPTGWTGTSTGCHGGTRYWTPGSVPGSGCY